MKLALKVNIAKTKVMISGNGIVPPSTSGKLGAQRL